ncbi:MAG TPA: hypothetical protein DCG28_03585 [Lachnospiraceae bacterium]|nr:hypothetical protein [Lachnospiraceae bacterium]
MVTYSLNFTPAKPIQLWAMGENTYIHARGGYAGCPIDDISAAGKYCYLKAYYGDGEKDYIISQPFKVSDNSGSSSANYQFTAQPQDITYGETNVVKYSLNFTPTQPVQLWAMGENAYIHARGGYAGCPVEDGSAAGKYCYLKVYYGNGEKDYITSQPFEVNNNCAFTTQPKDIIYGESNVLTYSLNFTPAKPIQLWAMGENTYIHARGGYAGCPIDTDDIAGKYCYLKAYYGSGERDFIISRCFNVYEPCTVTFNANGGSGTMEDITVKKDGAYKLPECDFTAPTNTGFYKWRIKGKLYSAGDEVEISDNTVLYATWYVKEVRKRVTEPTIGAMPDNTMTDDTVVINGEPVKFEDYTIVLYSNYGDELGALLSEPFKMKTRYNFVAHLSLNSNNSYYYSDDTHYYINGEEASLDTSKSGIKYAIINYTFPPMKYQQLVFDKEKSKFEVGGTLYFDTEIFESIFNEISAASDEAVEAVLIDEYWEYKWYADDELVYTSTSIADDTFTVPYDCSGKTVYAVLEVGDQTAKSEEVSIPVCYYKGDIDHDGYVTDKDATLLLKYINGIHTLTENQKSAAKATDSTKAEPDMLDAVWILKNKTSA